VHVLLFGPIPPPFGGVQVHLMALREHLRSSGDRVSVINITRHRQADHDDLYYPETAAGVITRIAQLKPDVLHVHLGGFLGRRDLLLCLACGLWPGARSVLTFHSGGYPSTDAARAASGSSATGRVLQQLDAIIAVNQSIADVFHRFGCRPERVSVIEPHSTAGLAGVGEQPWPARFEAFARAHDPVFVTVGLLEPEYGLDLQIAALPIIRQSHPNAGLIIIGSGSLQAEIERLIAASPASAHILLAGDVPHQETLASIARCDLLLRPTAYDGDSVSVREALALGTPVLASDNKMRPAGVHLLPERTVEALARSAVALAGKREAGAGPAAATANLESVRAVYQRLLTR
jgi:glycosyltransferase involved in cell wall biosynthesis